MSTGRDYTFTGHYDSSIKAVGFKLVNQNNEEHLFGTTSGYIDGPAVQLSDYIYGQPSFILGFAIFENSSNPDNADEIMMLLGEEDLCRPSIEQEEYAYNELSFQGSSFTKTLFSSSFSSYSEYESVCAAPRKMTVTSISDSEVI